MRVLLMSSSHRLFSKMERQGHHAFLTYLLNDCETLVLLERDTIICYIMPSQVNISNIVKTFKTEDDYKISNKLSNNNHATLH